MKDPRPTLTAQEIDNHRHGGRDRPGLVLLFTEHGTDLPPVHRAAPFIDIGRDPGLALSVDDPVLSREHARFRFDARGIRVQDLGSHNGTFVNGRRVAESALRPGDVVRCGSCLLLVTGDVEAFRGWPGSAEVPPLLGGPQMERLRQRIGLLAARPLDVLVLGESGTGKDVVARLIHRRSGAAGDFVPLNCAALPEPLFEAELFGAARGAFTGAEHNRPGLMEAARGGTLFLDEIGELPPSLQAKLLRAVEQREVRPVGCDRPRRVDLRLVAATNRDLVQEVAAGRFREDLYHRLCRVTIRIPPLRERPEDVLFFGRRFAAEQAADLLPAGEPGRLLTAGAAEQLLLHRWGGNVRELQQVLREALLQAATEGSDRLLSGHLPPLAAEEPGELARLRAALGACGGNVTEASAVLGWPRSRVYALLKAHGLKAADFR